LVNDEYSTTLWCNYTQHITDDTSKQNLEQDEREERKKREEREKRRRRRRKTNEQKTEKADKPKEPNRVSHLSSISLSLTLSLSLPHSPSLNNNNRPFTLVSGSTVRFTGLAWIETSLPTIKNVVVKVVININANT
jgi:hypothetical protein